MRQMAQRSRRWSKDRGVKEYGDKKVVIFSIHDTGIKLTQTNVWVKRLHRLSWPRRMTAVGKENRPESGRFPKGKDDDTLNIRGGGNLLPCGDQLSDGWRNEDAFVGPVHRKRVCSQRSRIGVARVEAGAASVRRRGKGIQGKTSRKKTRLEDEERRIINPPIIFIE